MIELYAKAGSIYIDERINYDYTQNIGSILHRFRKNALNEWFILQEKMKGLLEKEGLYEDTKERYALQKLCAYSSLISVYVQSDKFLKEKVNDIKLIREYFIEEKFPDDLYSQLALKTRTGLYLLKHKMYVPLILVYSLKEKLHSLRLR